jgi:hypothetical protein
MPSRRTLLAGLAGGLATTAGCLGDDDPIARCSSRGEGTATGHLRRVAPIRGDEEVALGVVVSETATDAERFDAITVRDRDGDLIAAVPLDDNREMSRLSAEEHPVVSADGGELYAVPLGPPPVHGDLVVSLVTPDGGRIARAELRFNCYAYDGDLP